VPVVFDDAAIVYMRADGGRSDLVERDGYALLDPARYLPGAFRAEQAPSALREADRAVRASRGSSIARVMRMDALLSLGRRADALAEENRLLAARPDLAHIYVFLGDIHLSLGDRQIAAARYRQALDLAPGWRRAADGLQASLAPP
jgi:tetratricopeptide (TPR) repeat protein